MCLKGYPSSILYMSLAVLCSCGCGQYTNGGLTVFAGLRCYWFYCYTVSSNVGVVRGVVRC